MLKMMLYTDVRDVIMSFKPDYYVGHDKLLLVFKIANSSFSEDGFASRAREVSYMMRRMFVPIELSHKAVVLYMECVDEIFESGST
jgi:hypothetical protein